MLIVPIAALGTLAGSLLPGLIHHIKVSMPNHGRQDRRWRDRNARMYLRGRNERCKPVDPASLRSGGNASRKRGKRRTAGTREKSEPPDGG